MSQASEKWFSFGDAWVYVEDRAPPSALGDSERAFIFIHGRNRFPLWGKTRIQLAQQGFLNRIPPSLRGRCFSFDLPGHGYSAFGRKRGEWTLYESAQFIEKLLSWLNSSLPVVLIGHDTGGALAQICALDLESQIQSVILVSPACLYHELKNSKHPWPLHYERRYWRHRLLQMKQPFLILCGKNDKEHPPHLAEDLARQIPHSQLEIHSTASHWLHTEDPGWVLEKAGLFLSRNAQKSLSR